MKYFTFHHEQQNACIKTLKTQKQRILAAMNFDNIARLPQHSNGSFPRPISIIALEKWFWLLATDIFGLRHCSKSERCVNEVFDTCRDYRCRDCVKCLRIASTWGDILYHASRNKRHESSRDRDISQLVHRFMKIFPSRFADKVNCERSSACLSNTDVKRG